MFIFKEKLVYIFLFKDSLQCYNNKNNELNIDVEISNIEDRIKVVEELYGKTKAKLNDSETEINEIKKEKNRIIEEKNDQLAKMLAKMNEKLDKAEADKNFYLERFTSADTYINQKQDEFLKMQKAMIMEIQEKQIQVSTTEVVLDRVVSLYENNQKYFESK